jgi:hypothetical protein
MRQHNALAEFLKVIALFADSCQSRVWIFEDFSGGWKHRQKPTKAVCSSP